MEDKEQETRVTERREYYTEEESSFGCVGLIMTTLIIGVKLAILFCVIFKAYIAAIVLASVDLTFWALMLCMSFTETFKRKKEPPDGKEKDDGEPFTDV